MTTLGDLVASIHSSLHSYTGVQEQVTWLTSGITATDLAIPVASSETVLRGIAEIDDELLYVDSSANNSLAIPALAARGFRGSVAAAHSSGAMVTYDPAFPRVEVRRAIEEIVQGVYPSIFRIKSVDIAYSPSAVGYDLPADCGTVLEVKSDVAGDPLNSWTPVFEWNFDPTSPEVNGKALNVNQWLRPGSTIRVVYAAPFGSTVGVSLATQLDDATLGIPQSCADLITFGATARLVRFLDPARLQAMTVENLSRSAVVQTGEAGKLANQLYAMYQQRLTEERSKLLKLTPARLNFTR